MVGGIRWSVHPFLLKLKCNYRIVIDVQNFTNTRIQRNTEQKAESNPKAAQDKVIGRQEIRKHKGEHQPCCPSCMIWRYYCIFLLFVCLDQTKNLCFRLFQSLGCKESKNKSNCERKSAMSSLDP